VPLFKGNYQKEKRGGGGGEKKRKGLMRVLIPTNEGRNRKSTVWSTWKGEEHELKKGDM